MAVDSPSLQDSLALREAEGSEDFGSDSSGNVRANPMTVRNKAHSSPPNWTGRRMFF